MKSVIVDTHAIIWYFEDQNRLSPAALTAFEEATLSGDANLQLVPLDLTIARAIEMIPHAVVPGMPLVSRDRKIQVSSIQTMW